MRRCAGERRQRTRREQERPIPEFAHILIPTIVALCLGALVGLERQVSQQESGGEKDFPGVRTLAFTSLLGALAVLSAEVLGQWIAVALFLASATFLVLRYRYDTSERGDPGYTTEIASLCTFAVGALAQAGELLVASAITIVMVALLRSKRALHRAGRLLSASDMEALIRFLVVTGIVLPLLPNEPLDPFGVLRPRDVWRMVVLISGLSFVGYVLMRIRAGQRSRLVMNLLSGMVSSTAATLAHARAARAGVDAHACEAGALLATSMSFVRIALVLAALAPALLLRAAPVLAGMFVVALVSGLLLERRSVPLPSKPSLPNPLGLRLALGFAAVYALVLLLAAAARQLLAAQASLVVTALAASVGADAPALTLVRLLAEGHVDIGMAATGIAGVALAATAGKLLLLLTVGRTRRLMRAVVALALVFAAGLALGVLV